MNLDSQTDSSQTVIPNKLSSGKVLMEGVGAATGDGAGILRGAFCLG